MSGTDSDDASGSRRSALILGFALLVPLYVPSSAPVLRVWIGAQGFALWRAPRFGTASSPPHIPDFRLAPPRWKRIYAPVIVVAEQPVAGPALSAWFRLWDCEFPLRMERLRRALHRRALP